MDLDDQVAFVSFIDGEWPNYPALSSPPFGLAFPHHVAGLRLMMYPQHVDRWGHSPSVRRPTDKLYLHFLQYAPYKRKAGLGGLAAGGRGGDGRWMDAANDGEGERRPEEGEEADFFPGAFSPISLSLSFLPSFLLPSSIRESI